VLCLRPILLGSKDKKGGTETWRSVYGRPFGKTPVRQGGKKKNGVRANCPRSSAASGTSETQAREEKHSAMPGRTLGSDCLPSVMASS